MLTIYVVSGRPRSGTSMMMRASVFGGMDAIYDPGQPHEPPTGGRINYFNDPNPHGYYEGCLGMIDFEEFPENTAGKLLKLQGRILFRVLVPYSRKNHVPFNYKVIYMRRPDDEINRSMMKAWGKMAPYADADVDVKELRTKDGVDLLEVDYPLLVADPMGGMQRIADWGWPIDVKAAADTVDPLLYRNRPINDPLLHN